MLYVCVSIIYLFSVKNASKLEWHQYVRWPIEKRTNRLNSEQKLRRRRVGDIRDVSDVESPILHLPVKPRTSPIFRFRARPFPQNSHAFQKLITRRNAGQLTNKTMRPGMCSFWTVSFSIVQCPVIGAIVVSAAFNSCRRSRARLQLRSQSWIFKAIIGFFCSLLPLKLHNYLPIRLCDITIHPLSAAATAAAAAAASNLYNDLCLWRHAWCCLTLTSAIHVTNNRHNCILV